MPVCGRDVLQTGLETIERYSTVDSRRVSHKGRDRHALFIDQTFVSGATTKFDTRQACRPERWSPITSGRIFNRRSVVLTTRNITWKWHFQLPIKKWSKEKNKRNCFSIVYISTTLSRPQLCIFRQRDHGKEWSASHRARGRPGKAYSIRARHRRVLPLFIWLRLSSGCGGASYREDLPTKNRCANECFLSGHIVLATSENVSSSSVCYGQTIR